MSFQSLILDMAGNVGTQSLAVAIRVLMDKQTSGKQKLTLILKESRVGLTNGFILGISSFLVIGGYLVLKGNGLSFAFAVSGCLGAAMILAMLISSLSGTVIPIFFQKIGVDPAVASGPLITTVNDLVAVITYGLSLGHSDQSAAFGVKNKKKYKNAGMGKGNHTAVFILLSEFAGLYKNT